MATKRTARHEPRIIHQTESGERIAYYPADRQFHAAYDQVDLGWHATELAAQRALESHRWYLLDAGLIGESEVA